MITSATQPFGQAADKTGAADVLIIQFQSQPRGQQHAEQGNRAYQTALLLLHRAMNDARIIVMNYQQIISIEPGKRGGRPCIRHMRIAVADVLGWLAAGQTHAQILDDFPELTEDDIRACLAYAADRERRLVTAST
jgi:uncharacterized protein (DUF433 family)